MSQPTTEIRAVELDNGEWIYMQVEPNVHWIEDDLSQPSNADGFERKGDGFSPATQAAEKLSDLISAMTNTVASALKDSVLGNVSKINLNFSVKLAGEAGIPFITSGKAEGSVNISVEFTPKKKDEKKDS